jgi:hypothetical protein
VGALRLLLGFPQLAFRLAGYWTSEILYSGQHALDIFREDVELDVQEVVRLTPFKATEPFAAA